MSVMNKPQIVAQIAEKTGESKASVERFLNAFEETVVEAVANDTEVKITGFLAVASAVRSARVMKNPRTGDPIEVPEKKTVRVRVLKTFRDKVAGE